MRINHVTVFFCLIFWSGLMSAQEVDLCEGRDWFAPIAAKQSQLCKGVLEAALERRQNAVSDLNQVIRSNPNSAEAYRAHEVLLQMHIRDGRFRDALREAEAMLILRPQAADILNLRPLLLALGGYPPLSTHLRRSILPYVPTADVNPHFPVRINGKHGLFYADTGANIPVMSDEEAHALGLVIRSVDSKIGDISGRSVSMRVAEVDTLQIGRSVLRHVPFVILPASQPPFNEVPVDQQAILGIQILLAVKSIHVAADGSMEIAGTDKSEGVATPIAFHQSQPVVQMSYEGRSMPYTMDTGAVHTTLNPLFSETFPAVVQKGESKNHQLTGQGGTSSQPSIRVASLRFSLADREVTLSSAVILTKQTTSESAWAAGNLGYDLIRQTAPFTINFEKMTFVSGTSSASHSHLQ
ncbi:hypothetical protein FTW19_00195 [Terriglobus albidus]|uniref:Tetratricopeptide repeat protein n=1 Tax=Terriglobus albidus TaxID=1592106 RepID=A0A5B9E2N1_9BACT|nr:aspartyl protease family protein [Terriglobus albidus]QEE26563.1 hypothetical protein FTW19_00195 [Terriglobus albidus]